MILMNGYHWQNLKTRDKWIKKRGEKEKKGETVYIKHRIKNKEL